MYREIHSFHSLSIWKVKEVWLNGNSLADVFIKKKPLNQNKTYGAVMNNIECSWCLCFQFFFSDLEVKAEERRKTFRANTAKIVVMTTNTFFIPFLFSSPEKLEKHIHMWVVKARELDKITHEGRNLMDLLLFGLIKQMKNRSRE